MTLAIAMFGIDGLVLGTDSRVTGGEVGRADTSEKFLQVNRDTGVMTFGFASPGYEGISRLVEDVKRRRVELSRFSQIRDHAHGIFRETYGRFVSGQTVPAPEGSLGFILAGYDSVETNQFRIVSFMSPEFVPQEIIMPFFLTAQWHIAQYILLKVYFPEATVELLKDMAVFVIAETMSVHADVGGPMQLAIVDRAGGFQRLAEREIGQIITKNQTRFSRWRQIVQEAL